MILKPKEVLQYQNGTKGRGRKFFLQVLVEWKGTPRDETTWEDYANIVLRFPDFNLEDKDILKRRRNDISHIMK